MHLPEQDVKDLRKCRVGACDVKLDERAIVRFQRDIDWHAAASTAAVDALMQRIVLEYVHRVPRRRQRAIAGVSRQIPPGRRSPTSSARWSAGWPEFTTFMPEMGSYLLGFPKVTLPQSSSFIYWQETVFGLKPTLRVSHVTIRERQGGHGHHVQDDLRKSLRLDRDRNTDAVSRSGAWSRLLVRHVESKPCGWAHRHHRGVRTLASQESAADGDALESAVDETENRAASLDTAWLPLPQGRRNQAIAGAGRAAGTSAPSLLCQPQETVTRSLGR